MTQATGAPGTIEAAFSGRIGAFALDAAFSVPARGVTALFGPSGCGKTTVLRCMAGLTRLDGRCLVDGDVWQDARQFRPAHRRPVGYVFQEASLFPHLSVRRNLLYGAPLVPPPRSIAFDEVVRLLGLAHLLDRGPHHLSGGERQRVAVGRALLSQPRLLLMDEPLSALDRATKDEILPFLERLHGALDLPVLYVSHDMAEVERLADRLVLLERGRVLACGPLAALQSNPDLPLATTRDAAVSLDGIVESYDGADGLIALAVRGARFLVPAPPGEIGARRRLSIAAGDVSLALEMPRASTILNVVDARILSVTALRSHEMTLVLGLGADGAGDRLLARVTRRSFVQLDLRVGLAVHAQVKGVALAAAGSPPAGVSGA
ncbi:molybdenum ABC transporter ATP-binding protein [Aquabacter spiritensis]|uniref:Molybdate transport system ATP-binding protein n=1 Tax=Aquabacter spiritensis TaxID=933073 RepID=A0A4R3M128_9HYPH|nr:molybdenum ABC transporter ATP-binding protein [Aquabacter spiritensis]TCT06801.1 molybdate transport system ATP-binding protein [Aquabacter spiritensis]